MIILTGTGHSALCKHVCDTCQLSSDWHFYNKDQQTPSSPPFLQLRKCLFCDWRVVNIHISSSITHALYHFSLSYSCQQSMICSPHLIACQTCCRGVWLVKGWTRLSSWPPSSCNPGRGPLCLACTTPGTTASILSSLWWESSTEVGKHDQGSGVFTSDTRYFCLLFRLCYHHFHILSPHSCFTLPAHWQEDELSNLQQPGAGRWPATSTVVPPEGDTAAGARWGGAAPGLQTGGDSQRSPCCLPGFANRLWYGGVKDHAS